MGAACTKSAGVSEPKSQKRETKERKETKPIEPAGRSKTITIGVFGIEGAGKTTIIKAIDGDPTDDVRSTTSETTTTITEPFVAPENRKKSNQNRTTLRLIDVSGTKSSREKLWEKQYDKIHGWIFVVDPTNRKRIRPSQETLDDLYDNKKIKDKPVLFLLTKQDQSGSIKSKEEFCDDFDLDRFKPKCRIALCVGVPQRGADRIDPSLRQGVQWLIRTIEDNYGQLNSRVTKTNDSDSERETKWNSSRLPDIRQKPLTSRSFKDDDDDDDGPQVTRRANSAQQKTKSFRASYETLPEDTPWSTSKIDEKFPRLTTKSSLTINNSTRKRDISPLVHDTKLSSYGTSTKKNSDSDDENDRRRKPNPISRFDQPTNSSIKKFQANRFDDDDDDEDYRSTLKKSTKRSNYDDDDDNDTYNNSTQVKKVLPKSRFDHDDDDEDENRYSNSKFQSNRFKSSRDFSD